MLWPVDEAMARLLDYDRRRYWLENGWSLRFRVRAVGITAARPHGLRYAFTLHDVDGTRLLGFDNAHGIARHLPYDHRHRFRRPREIVPYAFQDADTLICDFFDAIEQACRREAVPFAFVEADLATEHDDDPDQPA